MIYLVSLAFEILFYDADDGLTYAGDGSKPIKAFMSRDEADKFVAEWNPIVAEAEKETIVFPVQANNAKLKKELGFTLHDIQETRSFHLEVTELPIIS